DEHPPVRLQDARAFLERLSLVHKVLENSDAVNEVKARVRKGQLLGVSLKNRRLRYAFQPRLGSEHLILRAVDPGQLKTRVAAAQVVEQGSATATDVEHFRAGGQPVDAEDTFHEKLVLLADRPGDVAFVKKR